MRTRHALFAAATGALLGLAAAPVRAADHLNLDENLPVRIEDAYPIPYNGIEAQGYFRYDHTTRDGRGDSVFKAPPRLEAGLFRNFQFSFAVPYRLGDASETKLGDVEAQRLYNFDTEGVALPALSLAFVDEPFGYQAGGTETEVKVIATKSLGSVGESYVPPRLHLNAAWFHNYDPLSTERDDRYLVGVGYNQPVANDWLLVAGRDTPGAPS